MTNKFETSRVNVLLLVLLSLFWAHAATLTTTALRIVL